MTNRRRGLVTVGSTVVIVLVALTGPVLAAVARLSKIPLGKGSATITWTGASGVTPTITSIGGSADGFSVKGIGTVPTPPHLGDTGTVTLPAQLPIAIVRGTLGGSAFAMTIDLNLGSSLGLTPGTSSTPFGSVTGTFRGMPVAATLRTDSHRNLARFSGTIGTYSVSGTISEPTHHGRKSTAHAEFVVSK